MKISEELSRLRETDIYSLILFALYKVREVPELSPTPELVYVLDKENFLKLCEYFGGQTIRIPTIKDLEILVYALVVYQFVYIEGKTFDEAVASAGDVPCDMREFKSKYGRLCETLEQYSFFSRSNE